MHPSFSNMTLEATSPHLLDCATVSKEAKCNFAHISKSLVCYTNYLTQWPLKNPLEATLLMEV